MIAHDRTRLIGRLPLLSSRGLTPALGTSFSHISAPQVPFKVVVINQWLIAKLLACLTFEMEITIVHFSGYLW